MRETNVLKQCELAATRLGARVFRNNVGVAYFPDGSVVRYGLCPGSADLIGWVPVTVTPGMVGTTIARFLAIECKTKKKKPTDKQRHFLDAVNAAGGVAFSARSGEDVEDNLD